MNSPNDQSNKQERVAFRELTESNMEQYELSQEQDFPTFNPSDVAFNESDLNAAFRSIRASDVITGEVGVFARVADQSTLDNDVHMDRKGLSMNIRQAERLNETASKLKQERTVERIRANRGPIEFLKKPIFVPKSHLRVGYSIDELISRLESSLDKCAEVAYSFVNKECKWDAVYLRGSCRCHFEICVYRENEVGESSAFIIEGNRLSGDGMIFSGIFASVKKDLLSPNDVPSKKLTDFSTMTMPLNSLDDMPIPSYRELSLQDTRTALMPIVDMARSSQVDAKIESARIMCDLSGRLDMHACMCETGCVTALVDLMMVEHEWCNQHAICALANLSISRPCQDVLMGTPTFFPALMRLVRDGSHSSVEMRRECARMLANLCAGFGPRIVNAVGFEVAATWVDSVENIRDDRLKLHAERAKAYLIPALQCI